MAAAAFAPALAQASAWRAPEGGEEIRTIVGGVSDDAFLYESEVYFEHPVTSRIDAVIAPRAQTVTAYAADGSGELVQTVQGELSAGAKFSLYEGGHSALAVQTGLVWRSAPSSGCAPAGAEARVLAGTAHGPVFGEAQAAYRSGGQCQEGRLDLTAGWRASARWMGLGQTFVDIGPGRSPVIKLQLSLVRFNDAGAGLQVGVRVRADPEGNGERALVVGWWRSHH
jgi:hypothetical protein